jgi:hypothetical protein
MIMHATFNENFYIVSATVIPLFYVTLFLQGSWSEILQSVLRKGGQRADYWLVKSRKTLPDQHMRKFAYNANFTALIISTQAVFWLAELAIICGVVSEIISLTTLFYQSGSLLEIRIVFWSMVGLLVLMAVRPVFGIMYVTFINWESDDSSSKADGE